MLWHSYCVMSNHPHATGRLTESEPAADPEKFARGGRDFRVKELSKWMHDGHQEFATGYNKRHDRRGHLASDRADTPEIEAGGLLDVMVYGDLNPVKAGMVARPEHYRYSSYNFYAHGERNEHTNHLVIPQDYLDLGDTPTKRQRAYRRRVRARMKALDLLNDVPEGPPDPTDVDSVPITTDALDSAQRSAANEGEQRGVGPPVS